LGNNTEGDAHGEIDRPGDTAVNILTLVLRKERVP
jgi:hypothetical protein